MRSISAEDVFITFGAVVLGLGLLKYLDSFSSARAYEVGEDFPNKYDRIPGIDCGLGFKVRPGPNRAARQKQHDDYCERTYTPLGQGMRVIKPSERDWDPLHPGFLPGDKTWRTKFPTVGELDYPNAYGQPGVQLDPENRGSAPDIGLKFDPSRAYDIATYARAYASLSPDDQIINKESPDIAPPLVAPKFTDPGDPLHPSRGRICKRINGKLVCHKYVGGYTEYPVFHPEWGGLRVRRANETDPLLSQPDPIFGEDTPDISAYARSYASTRNVTEEVPSGNYLTVERCARVESEECCKEAAIHGYVTEESFNNCHLCQHPDCTGVTAERDDPGISLPFKKNIVGIIQPKHDYDTAFKDFQQVRGYYGVTIA